MLKRSISILAALALLAGGCAGAPSASQSASTGAPTPPSSAGPSATPAGPSGEIKFVGFAGSAGAFEARAAEFMKTHPEIKVTVEGVPATSWGELMQAIAINIAGGNAPDIADIASEGQRAFADNNIITPIDDYLARDQAELQETLADIDPRLLDALKIDGKSYGLPTVWNNMVIYYNKRVLQEAGLEPPTANWTIDDFISMSQQVTASSDDKWGYAFGNGYFVTLVPWMLVNDGNVLTDDWTQSRLTDPNTVAAVQLLHDFVYKHEISPKLDVGVSDFDLFVQNKLAFMGAGMWQVNGLKNANFPADDYDVVPFPKVKTSKTVIGIGAAPIFTASQNKDAAWEFAKFLTSKDFQETFIAADGWSIPATRGAFAKIQERPDFPANGSIFYDSARDGVLVPAPKQYGAIEAALMREFGAAMANAKTVEEALAAAEAEVNAALGQP